MPKTHINSKETDYSFCWEQAALQMCLRIGNGNRCVLRKMFKLKWPFFGKNYWSWNIKYIDAYLLPDELRTLYKEVIAEDDACGEKYNAMRLRIQKHTTDEYYAEDVHDGSELVGVIVFRDKRGKAIKMKNFHHMYRLYKLFKKHGLITQK